MRPKKWGEPLLFRTLNLVRRRQAAGGASATEGLRCSESEWWA